ncbi:type II toxin-antitoxin system PemK/MazF family toxin, partial [Paenibacillus sp. y28]|uniref:type II toxin-antitoxin system PemK/MazF family toxin n=1 Tax=Paenibacillus sp. y28 TaxID=3129110 RepID=UPI0030187611
LTSPLKIGEAGSITVTFHNEGKAVKDDFKVAAFAAPNDPYDVPLFKWAEAGLREPSVARVAKTIVIQQSKVDRKLGHLAPTDLTAVLSALARFHN